MVSESQIRRAGAEPDLTVPDLWRLVWGAPQVDPNQLAAAIERELSHEGQDFRTRVLIRDSIQALEHYWGKDRLDRWLQRSPFRHGIKAILEEDLGEPGFPLLLRRIMERTEPEVVTQYLRELGTALHEPVSLPIGGAIALILTGHLSRATDDIDVVDELPDAVRNNRTLLDELAQRFGLRLTHFQSHYLPSGWRNRLRFLGSFGQLQVSTVDVYDLFVGKLFSARPKDRDDLRALWPGLPKESLIERLRTSAVSMLADTTLRPNAERNWYILFGEPLPQN